ncbi:MAG: hypothetical protein IJJ19_00130 [Erysipelotrichaceae bacterium]|nr:hypothetical protein [Erysipelotrichaceae bacterium]
MSEQKNPSLEEKIKATEINAINITGNLVKSIMFKNNISAYIIMVCGAFLFLLRNIWGYLLGVFSIGIALFVLLKVKDHKVMDIYDDAIVMYADDEGKTAAKISFDEIIEWTIQNNASGVDAVMLKLKSGEVIYKNTFQVSKCYDTLMKFISERESRVIQMEKNRQKEFNLKENVKKWFNKLRKK